MTKTSKTKVVKEYEITGVIDYAHCFSFTVKATSKARAKKIAQIEAKRFRDPAIAEYQTTLIDEPVLLQDNQ